MPSKSVTALSATPFDGSGWIDASGLAGVAVRRVELSAGALASTVAEVWASSDNTAAVNYTGAAPPGQRPPTPPGGKLIGTIGGPAGFLLIYPEPAQAPGGQAPAAALANQGAQAFYYNVIRTSPDVGAVDVILVGGAGPAGPVGPPGPQGPAGASLIWQPGGPGGGAPNVYASWAALYAVTEPGAEVLVDPSYDAAPSIPAASYPNIRVMSLLMGAPGSCVVTTLDGVVLPNLVILGEGLLLNVQATTVCPLVRGDGQVFICRAGAGLQKDPAGTLPALRFTPGSSSSGGPVFYQVGGADGQGGAPAYGLGGDYEINPLPGATNAAYATYEGYGAVSETWVSAGADAALAVLLVQYENAVTLGASSQPLTQSGVAPGAWSITNNAGLCGVQFGARTSGTSGGALTAWVPCWNAATVDAGILGTAPLNDQARCMTTTVLTTLEVELVGSGSGSGANPTTFQLYSGNIAIPGALVVIDVDATGTQSARVDLPMWVNGGTQLSLQLVTTGPVPVAFTQINAVAFGGS